MSINDSDHREDDLEHAVPEPSNEEKENFDSIDVSEEKLSKLSISRNEFLDLVRNVELTFDPNDVIRGMETGLLSIEKKDEFQRILQNHDDETGACSDRIPNMLTYDQAGKIIKEYQRIDKKFIDNLGPFKEFMTSIMQGYAKRNANLEQTMRRWGKARLEYGNSKTLTSAQIQYMHNASVNGYTLSNQIKKMIVKGGAKIAELTQQLDAYHKELDDLKSDCTAQDYEKKIRNAYEWTFEPVRIYAKACSPELATKLESRHKLICESTVTQARDWFARNQEVTKTAYRMPIDEIQVLYRQIHSDFEQKHPKHLNLGPVNITPELRRFCELNDELNRGLQGFGVPEGTKMTLKEFEELHRKTRALEGPVREAAKAAGPLAMKSVEWDDALNDYILERFREYFAAKESECMETKNQPEKNNVVETSFVEKRFKLAQDIFAYSVFRHIRKAPTDALTTRFADAFLPIIQKHAPDGTMNAAQIKACKNEWMRTVDVICKDADESETIQNAVAAIARGIYTDVFVSARKKSADVAANRKTIPKALLLEAQQKNLAEHNAQPFRRTLLEKCRDALEKGGTLANYEKCERHLITLMGHIEDLFDTECTEEDFDEASRWQRMLMASHHENSHAWLPIDLLQEMQRMQTELGKSGEAKVRPLFRESNENIEAEPRMTLKELRDLCDFIASNSSLSNQMRALSGVNSDKKASDTFNELYKAYEAETSRSPIAENFTISEYNDKQLSNDEAFLYVRDKLKELGLDEDVKRADLLQKFENETQDAVRMWFALRQANMGGGSRMPLQAYRQIIRRIQDERKLPQDMQDKHLDYFEQKPEQGVHFDNAKKKLTDNDTLMHRLMPEVLSEECLAIIQKEAAKTWNEFYVADKKIRSRELFEEGKVFTDKTLAEQNKHLHDWFANARAETQNTVPEVKMKIEEMFQVYESLYKESKDKVTLAGKSDASSVYKKAMGEYNDFLTANPIKSQFTLEEYEAYIKDIRSAYEAVCEKVHAIGNPEFSESMTYLDDYEQECAEGVRLWFAMRAGLNDPHAPRISKKKFGELHALIEKTSNGSADGTTEAKNAFLRLHPDKEGAYWETRNIFRKEDKMTFDIAPEEMTLQGYLALAAASRESTNRYLAGLKKSLPNEIFVNIQKRLEKNESEMREKVHAWLKDQGKDMDPKRGATLLTIKQLESILVQAVADTYSSQAVKRLNMERGRLEALEHAQMNKIRNFIERLPGDITHVEQLDVFIENLRSKSMMAQLEADQSDRKKMKTNPGFMAHQAIITALLKTRKKLESAQEDTGDVRIPRSAVIEIFQKVSDYAGKYPPELEETMMRYIREQPGHVQKIVEMNRDLEELNKSFLAINQPEFTRQEFIQLVSEARRQTIAHEKRCQPYMHPDIAAYALKNVEKAYDEKMRLGLELFEKNKESVPEVLMSGSEFNRMLVDLHKRLTIDPAQDIANETMRALTQRPNIRERLSLMGDDKRRKMEELDKSIKDNMTLSECLEYARKKKEMDNAYNQECKKLHPGLISKQLETADAKLHEQIKVAIERWFATEQKKRAQSESNDAQDDDIRMPADMFKHCFPVQSMNKSRAKIEEYVKEHPENTEELATLNKGFGDTVNPLMDTLMKSGKSYTYAEFAVNVAKIMSISRRHGENSKHLLTQKIYDLTVSEVEEYERRVLAAGKKWFAEEKRKVAEERRAAEAPEEVRMSKETYRKIGEADEKKLADTEKQRLNRHIREANTSEEFRQGTERMMEGTRMMENAIMKGVTRDEWERLIAKNEENHLGPYYAMCRRLMPKDASDFVIRVNKRELNDLQAKIRAWYDKKEAEALARRRAETKDERRTEQPTYPAPAIHENIDWQAIQEKVEGNENTRKEGVKTFWKERAYQMVESRKQDFFASLTELEEFAADDDAERERLSTIAHNALQDLQQSLAARVLKQSESSLNGVPDSASIRDSLLEELSDTKPTGLPKELDAAFHKTVITPLFDAAGDKRLNTIGIFTQTDGTNEIKRETLPIRTKNESQREIEELEKGLDALKRNFLSTIMQHVVPAVKKRQVRHSETDVRNLVSGNDFSLQWMDVISKNLDGAMRIAAKSATAGGKTSKEKISKMFSRQPTIFTRSVYAVETALKGLNPPPPQEILTALRAGVPSRTFEESESLPSPADAGQNVLKQLLGSRTEDEPLMPPEAEIIRQFCQNILKPGEDPEQQLLRQLPALEKLATQFDRDFHANMTFRRLNGARSLLKASLPIAAQVMMHRGGEKQSEKLRSLTSKLFTDKIGTLASMVEENEKWIAEWPSKHRKPDDSLGFASLLRSHEASSAYIERCRLLGAEAPGMSVAQFEADTVRIARERGVVLLEDRGQDKKKRLMQDERKIWKFLKDRETARNMLLTAGSSDAEVMPDSVRSIAGKIWEYGREIRELTASTEMSLDEAETLALLEEELRADKQRLAQIESLLGTGKIDAKKTVPLPSKEQLTKRTYAALGEVRGMRVTIVEQIGENQKLLIVAQQEKEKADEAHTDFVHEGRMNGKRQRELTLAIEVADKRIRSLTGEIKELSDTSIGEKLDELELSLLESVAHIGADEGKATEIGPKGKITVRLAKLAEEANELHAFGLRAKSETFVSGNLESLQKERKKLIETTTTLDASVTSLQKKQQELARSKQRLALIQGHLKAIESIINPDTK